MTSSTAAASTAPGQSAPAPAERGSSRTRLVVAVVLLALVALVAGVLLGRGVAPTAAAAAPGELSAEAGFARDMQTHHNQAVEMSILIRERSDDDEIRLLALDILTAQAQQSGQMFAWLAAWGLPQTSREPEMAWMARPTLDGGMDEHSETGHGGEGGEMPGFASAEQIAALTDASGVEAERLWLELMIDHHIGGVDMAEAVLARSEHPLVVGLANGIVASQEKEITYMTELLEARS